MRFDPVRQCQGIWPKVYDKLRRIGLITIGGHKKLASRFNRALIGNQYSAMPIYEFYSPDTNRIYSFYAKTLAQGRLTPKCPDNPKARMVKLLSSFAVVGRKKADSAKPETGGAGLPAGMDESKMEAAMGAMEREFSGADENDPKAMARMMRRMAAMTGEKLEGPMEEAMRKLEEGADPEALEAEMGGMFGPEDGEGAPGEGMPAPQAEGGEAGAKCRAKVRRAPTVRDPKLYDYE